MKQKYAISGEDAAIRALSYLAADEERLQRFLDLTGLTRHTIREAAATPGFLAAVLDHFLNHEPSLLEFAQWANLDPAGIVQAREALR